MLPFDGATRRVLVSHSFAALALSVPWPLLLVMVAERSDDPWLLGLAGAARMLPFIACSWATGRLADLMRRDLIVRLTLWARAVAMLVAAVALVADHVWVAVAATTVAVAVATPAYPAMVAAMPGIAGKDYRRATDLLVTIEVGAFVVGAAIGGLLLQPVTREVIPWLPLAMTAVAMVLILPVSMPAPRKLARAARPSALRALRGSPAARRAIAAMAAVNVVDSVAALALLPIAVHSWSAGATGYGIATGVLGFAALGAPLLRRIGRSPSGSMRRGLVLLAGGLVLVTPAPALGWAVVPIAILGAASVAVESAATGVLQDAVPDEVRATVLGLNDTVIIAAALVGALAAPALVALTGGLAVFATMAVAVLVVAWWARPVLEAGAGKAVAPLVLERAGATT